MTARRAASRAVTAFAAAVLLAWFLFVHRAHTRWPETERHI